MQRSDSFFAPATSKAIPINLVLEADHESWLDEQEPADDGHREPEAAVAPIRETQQARHGAVPSTMTMKSRCLAT